MLDPTALMWLCFDMPHLPLALAKNLPSLPGVYVVYHREDVLYIGKTRDLHRRWKAHHRRYQLTMFGDDVEIAWHAMPDSDALTRTLYERSLITTFAPRLNAHITFASTPPVPKNLNAVRAVNAIRGLYESQHKTRKDLAEFLHKSELTIWRYEEGRSDIPANALQGIARFLGVSVGELLTPIATALPTPVGVEGD
jgi:DNA-binding XRE family transcriptional regulator